LAPALKSSFTSGAVFDDGGFEALIALFDSTITFHAQYQQSHEISALLDLLVLDQDNPRSLGWVAQTLRGRLSKLAGAQWGELDTLAQRVPDPQGWSLSQLCADANAGYTALHDMLSQYAQAGWQVSDEISLRYFTHAAEAGHSMGA
jgi:uncharacterized alpha-E superfamily protein